MHERTLDLTTPDGAMETFITHPEQGGPFPCVIIYGDFWGVREELYDIARKVAVAGYYVVLPDLFYRAGKHRVEFRNDKGQTISSWLLTPEQMGQAAKGFQTFTDEKAVGDTQHILEFLATDPAARPGGVGAFGYCLGGRLVMKVAAAYPERFAACGVIHGTDIANDRPDSAHLGLSRTRAEFYFGCPETDEHAPPESIELLRRTLQANNVRHHIEVHRGALHGYSMPDRDIFDKQAYNRDYELMFAMFHRQIPPGFAP